MESRLEKGSARKREPLAQRAYGLIKEDILSHRLLPRQPLREVELATKYQTSKTPIREALLILASEGIVEMHAFRGMRVRDFTADDAREIYELKEILEPLALARAIPLMTVDDFVGLREVLAGCWRAAERGDQRELSRLNQEFHDKLVARCGNSRTRQTLGHLQSQIRVMALRFWRSRATYVEDTEEHEAILEAAESQDTSLASELLRAHLAQFRERYMHELDD